MKLIIVGATGFVGTECVRQALSNRMITSVICIARKEVVVPEKMQAGADVSKLRTVVLEDWTAPYPDSVKEVLKGAQGCIWNLAITPTKSQAFPFDEVKRVNHDYTMNGMHNIFAVAKKPFRLVYTTGMMISRDPNKVYDFKPEYCRVRADTEIGLVDFADKHKPDVQVTCCRPGIIRGPGRDHSSTSVVAQRFREITGSNEMPGIHVSELAALQIDQAVNGVTLDPIPNDELNEMGKKLISEDQYVQ